MERPIGVTHHNDSQVGCPWFKQLNKKTNFPTNFQLRVKDFRHAGREAAIIDISKVRHMLLAAMFLLALGALVLHFSIHSPLNGNGELNFTNAMASLFPLVDVILVTWLFSRKNTAAWGYLINGLIVIYGTVFMMHCGWAKVYSPETPLWRYIITPTSPDIIIAWADFFMGAVLYRLWFLPSPKPASLEQTTA